MALLLGIDTGGTYTDSVLFDTRKGIIEKAKALTTKYKLTVGIGESLTKLLERLKPGTVQKNIELVSLSTTLATNAIVEGEGQRICLLLLGYPDDSLERAGLGLAVSKDFVVFVKGGHTVDGEEKSQLDISSVENAIEKHKDLVSAFAVSGYFSVKNPDHENRVRQLIREKTSLPVTCGHELTSNLHASRRALTTAFNARLIPLIEQLIASVEEMLSEHRIQAPLMVVKGDGSLISARFAREFPVETILSGPAASVVGAMHLTDEKNAFVVDMGGTTTDIALLHNGRPVLNTDGAIVGGWKTMIEAVEIYTYGIGGDSIVDWDDEGMLVIGPRRSVPLCLLAALYPDVNDILENQAKEKNITEFHGKFILRQVSPGKDSEDFSNNQKRMIELTEHTPFPLTELFRHADTTFIMRKDLEKLFKKGYLVLSQFTPTDAVHILGYCSDWDKKASFYGAAIMKKQGQGKGFGEWRDEIHFSEAVYNCTVSTSCEAVFTSALKETTDIDMDNNPDVKRIFIKRAFYPGPTEESQHDSEKSLYSVSLHIKRPLIAIGAPVHTYFPEVAKILDSVVHFPEHTEVANALGAVAGNVVQKVRILITPHEETEIYRAHTPEGIKDFKEYEKALDFSQEIARSHAEKLAERAGAAAVHIRIDKTEKNATAQTGNIFLETEVIATASGRPKMFHEL